MVHQLSSFPVVFEYVPASGEVWKCQTRSWFLKILMSYKCLSLVNLVSKHGELVTYPAPSVFPLATQTSPLAQPPGLGARVPLLGSACLKPARLFSGGPRTVPARAGWGFGGGVPECMRRARARERLGMGGMGVSARSTARLPAPPSQPAGEVTMIMPFSQMRKLMPRKKK